MTIRPGDTVKLKSGGPVMTIDSIDIVGKFVCHWFEGRARKTAEFSPNALILAKPEDSGGTTSTPPT